MRVMAMRITNDRPMNCLKQTYNDYLQSLEIAFMKLLQRAGDIWEPDMRDHAVEQLKAMADSDSVEFVLDLAGSAPDQFGALKKERSWLFWHNDRKARAIAAQTTDDLSKARNDHMKWLLNACEEVFKDNDERLANAKLAG